MKKILFAILILYLSSYIIHTDEYIFNPESMKSPRLHNSWVYMDGNYLTDEEINEINKEITAIEKETTVEIAVVVIPNTGGNIEEAAKKIGNLWGVGKKNKNNGLVLFASMDERKFRTQVGYGLVETFTDYRCNMLQEEIVIPNFKNGNYGNGILEYIKKIRVILNKPNYFTELEEQRQKQLAEYLKKKEEDERLEREMYIKSLKRKNITRLILFQSIALILFILGTISLVRSWTKTNTNMNKDYNKYSLIKGLADKGLMHGFTINRLLLFLIGGFISIVSIYATKIYASIGHLAFVIPFIGVSFSILLSTIAYKKKKEIINKWRNDPRPCPECGGVMEKLSEAEEDKYLKDTQIIEEELKTIDYDVWICSSCENKTIEDFKNWRYNFYAKCTKCGSIACKQTGSQVVSHPTYTSTGTRRLDFKCLACGYTYHKEQTIPRKVRTTSSSYSSSSYSSSSSYTTSSYSSSSSSSSSFGGGSFGSSGSTSSW